MSHSNMTVKQAVNVYTLISRRYHTHINQCKQCIGWYAEGPHCEEGHELMLLHNKWIERIDQAAQCEGRTITLPTLISEEGNNE